MSTPPLLVSERACQLVAGQPSGADGVMAAPADLDLAAHRPPDPGARRPHRHRGLMAAVSHGESALGLEWEW